MVCTSFLPTFCYTSFFRPLPCDSLAHKSAWQQLCSLQFTAAGRPVLCSAAAQHRLVPLDPAEETAAEVDPADLESEASLLFENETPGEAYQAAVQQLFAQVADEQAESQSPKQRLVLQTNDPEVDRHLEEAKEYLEGVLAEAGIADTATLCLHVLQRSFRWRRSSNGCYSCSEAPQASVLQERIEFLRSLGLTHEDIGSAMQRVPFVLGFSPAHMSQVTMFLTGLGLSAEDVAFVITREPRVLGFSVKNSLIPAVACFRRLGISNQELIRLLTRLPSVFGLSTERSLEPKLAFLQQLGVAKEDLPRVLVMCPPLLTTRMDRMQARVDRVASYGVSQRTIGRMLTVYPWALLCWDRVVDTLEFLLGLGVQRVSLDKIIHRHPTIFRSKVDTVMRPAVEWYMQQGISPSQLVPVILRHPSCICLQVEGKLTDGLQFLRDLGFSDQEVSYTLLVFPQLLGLSMEDNLKPTLAWLRSLGLSNEELVKVLRRMPQLLGLRIESMQQRVDFLLHTMGCPISDLAVFPPYLACSFENRIVPRYYFAAKHGKKYALSTLLASSDAIFCKRMQCTVAEYREFRTRLILQRQAA